MILCNFTPDAILWMHGGQDGTLKSGDIFDCPDPRGNHILNAYTRRGILQLQFGDDVDKIREKAMRIWKEFWMRQVTIFNQDNERRKNTNREYLDPSEDVSEHAQRLGVEVVGPWSVKTTDNETMRTLLNENTTLKVQIAQMLEQMASITAAMASRTVPLELRTPAEKVVLAQMEKPPEPEINVPEVHVSEDASTLVKEFSKLTKDRFGEWVMTNLDRIQSKEYPAAVRMMIKEKWERMIGNEFPVPV